MRVYCFINLPGKSAFHSSIASQSIRENVCKTYSSENSMVETVFLNIKPLSCVKVSSCLDG